MNFLVCLTSDFHDFIFYCDHMQKTKQMANGLICFMPYCIVLYRIAQCTNSYKSNSAD